MWHQRTKTLGIWFTPVTRVITQRRKPDGPSAMAALVCWDRRNVGGKSGAYRQIATATGDPGERQLMIQVMNIMNSK